MTQPTERDPVYRWSVALLGLSPLYIVFLGVEPVALTLLVRSMVVIIIPVLVGSLMKIANDRALMGEHRPSVFSNPCWRCSSSSRSISPCGTPASGGECW